LFNYVAIDNQFKGGVDVGNSKCGSLLPKFFKRAGFFVVKHKSSNWTIFSGMCNPQTYVVG